MVSVANRFSMSNCGVSCESVFATEFVESGANQFRYRIVVSAVNQFLLLNCGVSSKVVFTTKLWCQQQTGFRCKIMCCQ